MRLKLLAAAVTAAAATLSLATSAQASHSWGGYHWARTSNPFTLKLGDNLSSGWKTYLSTASSDWSSSAVLDTTVVTGQSNSACRATSGRVEVCNSTYGNNGWLGLASISLSSSTHISSGTVKVNDTYFNTSTYNTPSWRTMVMCQEVGHTFGLDHQDTNQTNANLGTCMDYTNSPDGPPSNLHPNSHDYSELSTIYSHTDSSSTVGLAAAVPAVGNSKKSWGKRVEHSASTGVDTYVRDFGKGNAVITYVFWAS
ncbi:hypothetical protein SMIR_41185 (plasmid) [Streptomyces mirabilis]|uniref:hypothetical protein n=1 Tax=Streptomyces mirabilis TaxID=68239 RepID=UPI001BB0CA33|nr:hypothetical protein [Streptomyces mirabilis]QUW85491.1 hypothetical protein SMIR_41185 [Streptomyces mirabilis]